MSQVHNVYIHVYNIGYTKYRRSFNYKHPYHKLQTSLYIAKIFPAFTTLDNQIKTQHIVVVNLSYINVYFDLKEKVI